MLYKLMELSDLYVDACIRDESGEMMFLSLYGRDTAIQQFLAALTLKENNGGFSSFRLSINGQDGVQIIEKAHVSNPDRLEKFSGRLPKENLFGNLVHTWIYDPVLLRPDKSSKSGWLVLDERFTSASRDRMLQGVWALYKTLSPVPLLDDWMEVVLRATKRECVNFLDNSKFPPLGEVAAVKVSLPDSFSATISAMVKAGMIGLDGQEKVCLEVARRAA